MQNTIETKEEKYHALVQSFKTHVFSDEKSWVNPYSIDGFDSYCKEKGVNKCEVLNPWNLWQGNLNADILVIGQDWGNKSELENLIKTSKEKSNNTNNKIIEFIKILGYEISQPYKTDNQTKNRLFFTNAILGIRTGAKSGSLTSSQKKCHKETWFYLYSLIQIIQPKCIIAIGGDTYEIIKYIFPLQNYNTFPEVVENNGKHNKILGSDFYAVYHPQSWSKHRTKEEQLSDWKEIAQLMKNK
ncbi:MAG: uracil-DNA glycosylase family protein [Bacteroidota bacterium]